VPTPTPTTTTPGAGVFTSLSEPQRLVDTRLTGGPLATGTSRCFLLAGVGSIPSGVAGVVLNMTAVGYGARGWLSVYPSGQNVPATSTLNFDPATYAMANGTLVRLGPDGQACVEVGTVNGLPGSVNVVLDATGFVNPAAASQMPLLAAPVRLADTRLVGGPIATGTSRCFTVASVAGIPADAAGVLLNVTAVGETTRGWLSIYPNGQAVPATSTLNFDPAGYATANGSIIAVGYQGQVCVAVGTIGDAPGSSNVVLDATGYLTSAGASQMPLLAAPVRLADTRLAGGPIASGQVRCFTVAGAGGIPSNATDVVLNVTAVGYGAQGWLTVFPHGQPVPATSTLNFDPAEYATANAGILHLGPDGQVCVAVGTVNNVPGSAQVILDATGSTVGAQVRTAPRR
jgi:hypothetical protein